MTQNYYTREEPDIVEQPENHWVAAGEALVNRTNCPSMMRGRKSKDAIGARNTVLLALCGPTLLDNTPGRK